MSTKNSKALNCISGCFFSHVFIAVFGLIMRVGFNERSLL